MSTELAELALKHSLLQTQFNTPVSLLDEDLMRLLSADAIRLAGLSQELMTKSALPGSTEERIIKLAERLMENEQLLAAQCRHYGDSVYQVSYYQLAFLPLGCPAIVLRDLKLWVSRDSYLVIYAFNHWVGAPIPGSHYRYAT